MKDTITDANFPRTQDQRVYHLGIRAGDVANRIVTVGSPSRAIMLKSLLDDLPRPVEIISERGFHTITGRYHGIPVSIISIGMGYPNMDFFVREVRECLVGDMVVVRLGSCGAIVDISVGSVVIPEASIAVTRNVDFDFANGESEEPPYRISRPVRADVELYHALYRNMSACSDYSVIEGTVSASADSFYSSQGRHTSFTDHNSHLVEELRATTPGLATLEMETFHLFHLAHCWNAQQAQHVSRTSPSTAIRSEMTQIPLPQPDVLDQHHSGSSIRAAAVHMVFASRTSQDFISPKQVSDLERWSGQHVLTVLSQFNISMDKQHPMTDSVWKWETEKQRS